MGRPNKPHEKRPGRWRFRLQGVVVEHAADGSPLRTEAAAWAELYRRTGGGRAPQLTIPDVIADYAVTRGATWRATLMGRFAVWATSARRASLRDMQPGILSDYAAWLSRQPSKRWGASGTMRPESVRHYVYAAYAALCYARDAGWISTVPARPRLPKSPVKPKALTRDELASLYRSIRACRSHASLLPMVRFGVATGLRPGSLCGMRWSDIDLSKRVMRLAVHKTAHATGEVLTLPISSAGLRILSRLDKKTDHVFLTRTGTPYTASGYASTLRKLGASPNRLRHTFAQRAMDGGAMQEDVGAALGHAGRSEMVRVYSRVSAERVRAAVEIAAHPRRVPPTLESRPPKVQPVRRGKPKANPPARGTDRTDRKRRAAPREAARAGSSRKRKSG